MLLLKRVSHTHIESMDRAASSEIRLTDSRQWSCKRLLKTKVLYFNVS